MREPRDEVGPTMLAVVALTTVAVVALTTVVAVGPPAGATAGVTDAIVPHGR